MTQSTPPTPPASPDVTSHARSHELQRGPASAFANTTARATLAVAGMTCASCQATVQRALERVPGVTDASVNLMTGDATVRYEPSATSPDALAQVVHAAGYRATVVTSASVSD